MIMRIMGVFIVLNVGVLVVGTWWMWQKWSRHLVCVKIVIKSGIRTYPWDLIWSYTCPHTHFLHTFFAHNDSHEKFQRILFFEWVFFAFFKWTRMSGLDGYGDGCYGDGCYGDGCELDDGQNYQESIWFWREMSRRNSHFGENELPGYSQNPRIPHSNPVMIPITTANIQSEESFFDIVFWEFE